MKNLMRATFKLFLLSLFVCIPAFCADASDDWQWLFQGELDGWVSNEEVPDVFSVTEDGWLKVRGGRAHLFWKGRDGIDSEFKDFEIEMEIMTTPTANSGFFFHTKFQEKGWPKVGLEAQVNTSHKDAIKTGSIYGLANVLNDAPSKDGTWFKYSIKVVGKTATVMVDGEVVNVYEEPADFVAPEGREGLGFGSGTFAIQGHDPGCLAFYREIRVRHLK